MALERELEVYREHLMEMLGDEGKFVVIGGEKILGCYATYELALEAGYEAFGLDSFLVKQIHRYEPIEYFSRDLSPCQP